MPLILALDGDRMTLKLGPNANLMPYVSHAGPPVPLRPEPRKTKHALGVSLEPLARFLAHP